MSPSPRSRSSNAVSHLGRRRASKSSEERFNELCSRASTAQDNGQPGVASSLLLEALKLAPVSTNTATDKARPVVTLPCSKASTRAIGLHAAVSNHDPMLPSRHHQVHDYSMQIVD